MLFVTFGAVLLARRPAIAAPKIHVAAAKDDAIAVTIDDGYVLTRTIRLLADNAEPAANVLVTVGPFQDAAGAEIPVHPPKRTFDTISLAQPAVYQIAAAFPRPGKYRADFDIVVADARVTTRIEVDVVTPPLGVKTQSAAAVRGEVGEPVTVALSLHEIAGRTWSFRPELAEAVVKGGDSKYQVGLHIPDGPRTNQRTIGPAEDLPFSVDVAGFTEAGQYEGTLRLVASGASALDVPFAAAIKEPLSRAALWIGAGVALSLLLRLWYGTWKKRLEARRDLARLDERMSALDGRGASDDGLALIGALRAHVAELRGQVALAGLPEDFAAVLARLWSKIPVAEAWLAADRTVSRMPAGDARDAVRAGLDDAAAGLERRDANDAAIAAVDQAVRDLKLRKSWRVALGAQLAAVRDAVKDASARTGAADDTARRIADEVEPLLRSADALLARDALEELAASDGPLAAIGMKLAEVLADGLRAQLVKPKPPPAMDEEAWKAHGAPIKRTLELVKAAPDADTALAAYNRALTDHLVGVAQSLAAAAKALADKVRAQRAGTAANLDTLAESLRTAIAAARKAGAPVAAATELSAAYDAAVESWPRLQAQAEGDDTRSRQVTALSDLIASLPAMALPAATRPARGRRGDASGSGGGAETAQQVATRTALLDAAAFVPLLVIAVASGLKLLWADDVVWGGTKDHLVAFLWGLGLSQVGAAPVFEGLLGLKSKLG